MVQAVQALIVALRVDRPLVIDAVHTPEDAQRARIQWHANLAQVLFFSPPNICIRRGSAANILLLTNY